MIQTIVDILDNSIIVALMTLPIFTSSKRGLWITLIFAPFVLLVKYILYRRGYLKVFPKFLDIGAIIMTVILLILEYKIDKKDRKIYKKYQDLIKYAGLLIIVIISLIAKNPITSQYRKENVPKSQWDNEQFKKDNVDATKIWVLLIILMGVLSQIPNLIGKGKNQLYKLIFSILLPLTIFVIMREYNQKVLPTNYGEAVERSVSELTKNVKQIKETVQKGQVKESLKSDMVQLKKEI